MAYTSDPRVDKARDMPLSEVVAALPLPNMRRDGGELVGPCPQCGGDDRFHINVKKGVFLCHNCDERGDGLQLAMHTLSCDFMGAVSHLVGDAEVVISPEELAKRKRISDAAKKKDAADAAQYREWSRKKAVGFWMSAIPWQNTPAEEYLEFRGLDLRSLDQPFRCFRYIAAHPYVKKIGGYNETLHVGPALISAVQNPRGVMQAVHQTWIDLSTKKGKAHIPNPAGGKPFNSKLVQGSKKGGAIRLSGKISSSTLIMGEGIETTGSVMMVDPIPGASYWAGVDLGNMSGIQEKEPGTHNSGRPDMTDDRAFLPPPHVKRLIFLEDGDSAPKPTRAKLTSGIRRAMIARPGLTGEIVSAGEGLDFNDILRGSET